MSKVRGSGSKSPVVKNSSAASVEFQNACKNASIDQDLINQFSSIIEKSDSVFRITNQVIPPQLYKVFLRLFQKYNKFQQIIFYSCPILDNNFLKQMAADFGKYSATTLCLDYCPINRDSIIPFLNATSLDYFSIRGNECLTTYDFRNHTPGPFSPSFNLFCNSLSTSQIKVLNLYGCHIGDDGAIAIAQCLYINTNLRCLCLSNNRIGDAGVTALANALSFSALNPQENIIVNKLFEDESKGKISDEGGGLVKRKKGNKGSVKRIPTKSTTKKSQLGKATNEKMLNFDPQSDVRAAVLSKWNTCIEKTPDNPNDGYVIPGNTTLTVLILDDNYIGLNGAMALQRMLAENDKIVELTLNGNPELDQKTIDSITRTIN